MITFSNCRSGFTPRSQGQDKSRHKAAPATPLHCKDAMALPFDVDDGRATASPQCRFEYEKGSHS